MFMYIYIYICICTSADGALGAISGRGLLRPLLFLSRLFRAFGFWGSEAPHLKRVWGCDPLNELLVHVFRVSSSL